MTPPIPDNLEPQLRALTTYRGESTNLWQRALDQSGQPRKAPGWLERLANHRISNRAMLSAAACIGIIFITAATLPSLQSARHGPPPAAAQNPERWSPIGIGQGSLGLSNEQSDRQTESARAAGLHQGAETWAQNNIDGGFVVASPRNFQAGQVTASPTPSEPAPPTRSVIQKATIDLQTPDVRATFAKASYLISSASGEFVETSSLTGEGKTAQANLTLRVSAARLSEVLNQLRELGKVTSEKTTGEDVTSQVVDLEARLRNEQRIERELLELLDKRADAPLKDILELRSSLSAVRQTIEQYIAQRDRLSHLVSLASILIVIRAEPEAEPKPEPAQSISAYFVNTISDTWHNGLRAASDSVSWLLSLLVSGILWWVLLATVILSILRYRRRLAARCV